MCIMDVKIFSTILSILGCTLGVISLILSATMLLERKNKSKTIDSNIDDSSKPDTVIFTDNTEYVTELINELPIKYHKTLHNWINDDITAEEASAELGFSKSTLYRKYGYIKKHAKQK